MKYPDWTIIGLVVVMFGGYLSVAAIASIFEAPKVECSNANHFEKCERDHCDSCQNCDYHED
jgi:hypothetical protein